MSDLSLIPIQDWFETQLSQEWNGATGTVYVLATPSYTPTTTNTYIVVNPWKTNMQIAEITDYDPTAKTLTVSSISFEKGLGISSTQQTHTTGSKVIISDNYQFWADIKTAINSKLDDTGGTMTGLLEFSGTTHGGIKVNSLTTVQRDALTPANGLIIYNTTTWEFQIYQGGAWSTIASGSTQPNASTTVLGKIKTDVAPASDPVALITDNPKYDALAGAGGSPSSSNLYETQYDTSNGSTKTATTISFVSGTKTIADSGNWFVTAGFKQGTQITVTGSASNNSTFTIVSVAAGSIVVAESVVTESAGASITITSVTADKIVRRDANGLILWVPLQAFFGDGSDGDVTISSNTSLTRDMYYNNLTINNGIILSPKGYRIFVKWTLTCTGTGKIASNGWAGWVGTAAINGWPTPGGAAWAVDYSNATLPNPTVWVAGGAGGAITGSNGTAGTNITLNSIGQSAVAGWAGGAGSSGAGGAGWTAGLGTDSPKSPARTYQSSYNLYDLIGTTITRHQISPTGGGGGGGGGLNSWPTPTGGGGGGSGSTGWFITIFANIIANLNVEAIGWAGGAGWATNLTGAGGGGGWAGGNGWFILIFYGSKTTVTATVTGGAGGAGWVATAPATNSGVAGTAWNSWVVLQIQI